MDKYDKILKQATEVNAKYKQLTHMSDKEIEDKLAIEYDFLYSNYETLFKISISENFNLEILKIMISNLRKIQSGELAKKDAEVKVGTVLVDEIVKPQLERQKKEKNL